MPTALRARSDAGPALGQGHFVRPARLGVGATGVAEVAELIGAAAPPRRSAHGRAAQPRAPRSPWRGRRAGLRRRLLHQQRRRCQRGLASRFLRSIPGPRADDDERHRHDARTHLERQAPRRASSSQPNRFMRPEALRGARPRGLYPDLALDGRTVAAEKLPV